MGTPRIDKLDKNYIINGNFDFFQRNTSLSSAPNASFAADRFKYNKSGTMVHTLARTSDVPSVAQSGAVSPWALSLDLTTPDTSIAATDNCGIQQVIEGQFFRELAGKEFRISFWVKAVLAGTYCLSLRNQGADRSCVFEYTIDAANTWEKKSIIVPASPADGTWNYANGAGVYIDWTLAQGTNLHTTSPGSWITGNFTATANQINGVNTGATYFRIAQVMVTEGSEQKAGYVYAGRDLVEELQLCQRYFEKSYLISAVVGSNTVVGASSHTQINAGGASNSPTVTFKVLKRITPTMTFYTLSGTVAQWTTITSGGVTTNRATTPSGANSDGMFIVGVPSNSDVIIQGHYTADAEI